MPETGANFMPKSEMILFASCGHGGSSAEGAYGEPGEARAA